MATSSSQQPQLILEPPNLALISTILQHYLPVNCQVYLFGSRANGKAKPYSDVDLALKDGDNQLALDLLLELGRAFSESDLPYRVDLIDLNDLSDDFRTAIEPDLLPLALT